MIEIKGNLRNQTDKTYYLAEIVEVYEDTDTADIDLIIKRVETEAGEIKTKKRLNNIPIKYYCPDNDKFNNHGAVVGASKAFDTGDEVIVKKEGDEYFIISHKTGAEPCLPSQFKVAVEDKGRLRWFSFDIEKGKITNMYELKPSTLVPVWTWESFEMQDFCWLGGWVIADLGKMYGYEYRKRYRYVPEVSDYLYADDPQPAKEAKIPLPSQVPSEAIDRQVRATSFSTSFLNKHDKLVDIFTLIGFFHPTRYPEIRTAVFKQVWAYVEGAGFFPLLATTVEDSYWKDLSSERGDIGECISSEELLGGFEIDGEYLHYYCSRISRGFTPQTPCPQFIKKTFKLVPSKNQKGEIIRWEYKLVDKKEYPPAAGDYFFYECLNPPVPSWFDNRFNISRYNRSPVKHWNTRHIFTGKLYIDLDDGEFKEITTIWDYWKGANIEQDNYRKTEEYLNGKYGKFTITNKLIRETIYEENNNDSEEKKAVRAIYTAEGNNWLLFYKDYRFDKQDKLEDLEDLHANGFPMQPRIINIYNDLDLFNSYTLFNFRTYTDTNITNRTFNEIREEGVIKQVWEDFKLELIKGKLNNGDNQFKEYQVKYSFIKTRKGRKLIFHNFYGRHNYVLLYGNKDIRKQFEEWLYELYGIVVSADKIWGFWLNNREDLTG